MVKRIIENLYAFLMRLTTYSTKKRIAATIDSTNGTKILDVCTNDGLQGELLLKRHIRSFGFDIRFSSLANNQKLARAGVLFAADANQIPIKSNALSCVLITYAFHDKGEKDQKRMISETYRILSDEGSLIVTEIAAPWNFFSIIGAGLVVLNEFVCCHPKRGVAFMAKNKIDSIVIPQGFFLRSRKRISVPSTAISIYSKQAWSEE